MLLWRPREQSRLLDRPASSVLSAPDAHNKAAPHRQGQAPPLPHVPHAVQERLAGRADLPELQDEASVARGHDAEGSVSLYDSPKDRLKLAY